MDVAEAAEHIKNGEIVAFPTETVFGLGANAFSAEAVQKIYAAKERPADNPCIVHIDDEAMLADIAKEVSETARKLMAKFWPGPLTIIFPKSDKIPSTVTAGLDTVAVRMPNHKIALELIRLAEVPIAAPSANKSGKPSPTDIEHVRQDFPDLPVVDGETTHGLESTVIALKPPRILRHGAVTLEELQEIVPDIGVAKQDSKKPESPGVKHKHYSPDRPLIIFLDVEELKKYVEKHNVVVLCKDEYVDDFKNALGLGISDKEMGKNLYHALRTELPGDALCVLGIEKKGIGRTIMDRLERAATRTL